MKTEDKKNNEQKMDTKLHKEPGSAEYVIVGNTLMKRSIAEKQMNDWADSLLYNDDVKLHEG